MKEIPMGIMSDGPIEGFTSGWAKFPFVGNRGHYWRDYDAAWKATYPDHPAENKVFETLCGLVGQSTPRAMALGMGNWPRCKHCNRMAKMLR